MPGLLDPREIIGFEAAIDRAYAAGFFDADGHANLRWNKSPNKNSDKRYPMLHISIGQKDPAILDWHQRHFGGNIYMYDPARNKRPTVFHQWSIVGTRAYVYYLQLRPYLRCKRKQLDDAATEWYRASRKPNLDGYQPNVAT